MKKGQLLSTHGVNGVVVNKTKKDWTKYDKENVWHGLKAKSVITIALDIDEFLWVSHCKTAKEMWDIL